MRKILLIFALLPLFLGAQTFDISKYSVEWVQQVAEGKLAGYEIIDKFGENPDIDLASFPEDVWSFGGLYVFSDTADIDRIVSSSTLDSQMIQITGLDYQYHEINEIATLTGQTPVVLANDYLRVFRMINIDDNQVNGTVYCYVDTTVVAGVPVSDSSIRAVIVDGANQTEMMIYTVPAGCTLYYYQGFVSLSRAITTSAGFTLRVRRQGGVFQVKRRVSLNSTGSTSWLADYVFPRVVPEKTDIVFRCEAVTQNNTGVSGGFSGILVKGR